MYTLLPVAITAALLSSPVTVALEHPASCPADKPARIVKSVRPEYPALAQIQSITGTSVVRVDLSSEGRVSGAFTAVSSGSTILDREAIRTAAAMVYAPEMRSCTATQGSYAVEVTFPG